MGFVKKCNGEGNLHGERDIIQGADFAAKQLAAKTLHKCIKYKPMLLQRATCVASLPCRIAAFTLAEVLITLGIIGVVAAMTIPIIITNSKSIQYRTA